MQFFACDFDGTLYRERQITAQDLAAIHAWRQAGNLFGIITGRGARTLLKELHNHPLECDFLLCNNGALFLDGQGELVGAETLPPSMTEAIFAHEAAHAASNCAVFSGTQMYIIEGGHGFWTKPEYEPPVISKEDALRLPYVQISLAFASRQSSQEWGERLQRDLLGLAKVQCSLMVADITAAHVSKATAIARTIEQTGWQIEKILVAGDDGNDIEMLNRYEGYAMRCAAPAVQQAAKHTADSIAQIIEQHI